MAFAIDSIAASDSRIQIVQQLWNEYWQSFGFPSDFQGFADELTSLPGKYAPPGGRLLLGFSDAQPAGTIALRQLRPDACEIKRLYVRPEFRGCGLARDLLDRVLLEARSAGYRSAYADTLPSMASALRLYYAMGFETVEPYSSDPTPGSVYLRLNL